MQHYWVFNSHLYTLLWDLTIPSDVWMYSSQPHVTFFLEGILINTAFSVWFISYDNLVLPCLLTQLVDQLLSVFGEKPLLCREANCSIYLGLSPLVQHRERRIMGRDEGVSEDVLWDSEVNCYLDVSEGHWIGWKRQSLHFRMVLLCLRACRVGTSVWLCLMGGDWQWASEGMKRCP